MQTDEKVLYEVRGGIARMTLNRPHVLNAIDVDVLQRVAQLLDAVQSAESVKAVILAGAGTAVSAGADIRYLSAATPMEVRDFSRLAVQDANRIERLGKPSLAGLNGPTFGGGLELAESCMIRVGANHAKLSRFAKFF